MMKSKNVFMYITMAVLLVFTITYFVIANKISYAFTDNQVESLFASKLSLINNAAKFYGENNLELFEEDKTIYLTVDELVEKGALLPDDEDGNIYDPSSEVRTMNELKVRITLKDGKIIAKVLI